MWAKDVKQYLAVCVPQMPNLYATNDSSTPLDVASTYLFDSFPILSAQSGVGSGSLLILMEQQIAYVTKCIQKCIREGYKSIVVKNDAVESFLQYADNYFDRTVYSGEPFVTELTFTTCELLGWRLTPSTMVLKIQAIANRGTRTELLARPRSEHCGLGLVYTDTLLCVTLDGKTLTTRGPKTTIIEWHGLVTEMSDQILTVYSIWTKFGRCTRFVHNRFRHIYHPVPLLTMTMVGSSNVQ